MPSRTAVAAAAKALIIACAGCSGDLDLSGPREKNELTEVHGTLFSAASAFANIAWSNDGKIGYVDPNLQTAYTRDAAGGDTSTILRVDNNLFPYGTPQGSQISHIGFGLDGRDVFTAENAGGQIIVRRHGEMTTTVLTRRGAFVWGTEMAASALVSATGDMVFVAQPDSVFVFRAGSSTPTFATTGCNNLAAFALDGSEVACFVSQSSSGRRIRLDNGAATLLDSNTNNRFMQARWTAAGLYLLKSYIGAIEVTRPGAATIVSPTYTYPEATLIFGRTALSADGHQLAYWNYYCAQASSTNLFGCDLEQYLIYVMDTVTGKARRVVVHTKSGSTSAGSLAFSPDGRRLAYTFGNSLYLIGI